MIALMLKMVSSCGTLFVECDQNFVSISEPTMNAALSLPLLFAS